MESSDADPTPEGELADDLLSIVTVFGARVYGARSGRGRKRPRGEAPPHDEAPVGGAGGVPHVPRPRADHPGAARRPAQVVRRRPLGLQPHRGGPAGFRGVETGPERDGLHGGDEPSRPEGEVGGRTAHGGQGGESGCGDGVLHGAGETRPGPVRPEISQLSTGPDGVHPARCRTVCREQAEQCGAAAHEGHGPGDANPARAGTRTLDGEPGACLDAQVDAGPRAGGDSRPAVVD